MASSYGLFHDVQPNPVAANVEAGIAVVRKGKHDGVIAFGGGSALDAAKVIAFMAGQTRPMWDFETLATGGPARPEGILPVIAVPTTGGNRLGSRSCWRHYNEENRDQESHFPPENDAGDRDCRSGADLRHAAIYHRRHRMDALAHCLEAYCAPGYHRWQTALRWKACGWCLKTCRRRLPTAGFDRARPMMSAAALANAFQKGLGAIHSLSHPIGSLYHSTMA